MTIRALLTAAACAAAIVGIAAPASADPGVPDSQRAYLNSVHEYTRSNPQAFPDVNAMTDQQLLDAGRQSCHIRDAEGGHFHRYNINPFIYSKATEFLCPQ